MAQMPPVKLRVHPSTFDLMMAVLEHNAASADDERTRRDAGDLMEKRMRFTRLYPGRNGQQYASVQMYEDEAAEMIWQLLYACAGMYLPKKEYSKELTHGGAGHD